MTKRRIDPLAIVAFTLAVLWIFGLGSLAAFGVGSRSRRRLRGEPDVLGRTVVWSAFAVGVFGLAVCGLWLGLSLSA